MTRVRDKQSNDYMNGHKKVTYWLGQPSICEACGRTDDEVRYEWANLSGKYLNIEDYARMCQPCHINYDDSATKGMNQPTAKLTDDDVREIRARFGARKKWQRGGDTQESLAEEFGVDQALIWRIVNGKAWTHVE